VEEGRERVEEERGSEGGVREGGRGS